jgi:DNA-binding response OmpR family regulator
MSKDDNRPRVVPKPEQERPRHHILVADDETSIRSLIRAVLLHAGYRVDTAPDGALAWAALQAEPYDLLITDYDMPILTGIDLIRKLRAARIGLPVIMVTGTLPLSELAENPSLQLAAALEKPFDVDELLEAVGKTLAAPVTPHAAVAVHD